LLISLAEATFILPCHLGHAAASESFAQKTRRWKRNMSGPVALTLGNVGVVIGFLWEQLSYPIRRLGDLLHWMNGHASRTLEAFTERVYRPALRWSIDHVAITVSVAFFMLMLSLGLVASGRTPFNVFPELDSKQ